MLERPRPPRRPQEARQGCQDGRQARSTAPAAVRARKARWRRRSGLVSLSVELHEHKLAEALIASGRLSPEQALQRDLVARELGRLVDDWCARWLSRHA
jgi:hypothetical protein